MVFLLLESKALVGIASTANPDCTHSNPPPLSHCTASFCTVNMLNYIGWPTPAQSSKKIVSAISSTWYIINRHSTNHPTGHLLPAQLAAWQVSLQQLLFCQQLSRYVYRAKERCVHATGMGTKCDLYSSPSALGKHLTRVMVAVHKYTCTSHQSHGEMFTLPLLLPQHRPCNPWPTLLAKKEQYHVQNTSCCIPGKRRSMHSELCTRRPHGPSHAGLFDQRYNVQH
ncbi:hypothetical protein COO60DRAFT_927627 [Scenedesmus sp. NREL 46B-D3]|nr:hypothetical protein COO60DRAFT_927627 [Scenedesmus sp. NREL 46B-D3]